MIARQPPPHARQSRLHSTVEQKCLPIDGFAALAARAIGMIAVAYPSTGALALDDLSETLGHRWTRELLDQNSHGNSPNGLSADFSLRHGCAFFDSIAGMEDDAVPGREAG